MLAGPDDPPRFVAVPLPDTLIVPLFITVPAPCIPTPPVTLRTPVLSSTAPVSTSIPTPAFTFIVPVLRILPPLNAAIPTVSAPHAARLVPRVIVPSFNAIPPSFTRIPTPPPSMFSTPAPLFVK